MQLFELEMPDPFRQEMIKITAPMPKDPWAAVGCCGLLWAAVGCCGLLWVTEIMAGQLVMLAVDPRKTYDLCQEWLALHPLPELEGWTEDAESFFS